MSDSMIAYAMDSMIVYAVLTLAVIAHCLGFQFGARRTLAQMRLALALASYLAVTVVSILCGVILSAFSPHEAASATLVFCLGGFALGHFCGYSKKSHADKRR